MANTENRLSNLPSQTDKLEIQALKDVNDTTLNDILDTINGVLSSKPSLNEIQTAEVYLANLKILSERYQSGIKDSMQSDNLDDEYSLYVGTKKRLQLLKTEMRRNMSNEGGTYDPLSGTYQAPFKNKKRGGSPLDTMMKGDEGEKLTSGVIGQQAAFYDNARGYGSIEAKFSDSVGFSAEGILSHMIGEKTAIAVDVEAGSKQSRFLTTLGYEITKNQRIKLTYEHFRRLTDFMFSSGEVSETIAQNSVGATYRLKLDKETLKYLELNGYMSKTSSKELEDKTFYIDTATLYELYNNKRRIAGGKKQGGSVSLGFEPWKGGELRLTANYESTKFDTRYENNRDVSRFGGKVSMKQEINKKTSLEVGVGTSSTESLVTEAKLRYALPDNVSLYIGGQHIQRRDGIGGSDSSEDIGFGGVDGPIPSWVPIIGEDTEAIKESARIVEQSKKDRKEVPYMPALHANRNPDALPPLTPTQSKQYNEFLSWVATQPAVKSYTVVALRDQANDRIIAIDRSILPAAAHPDLMTGDLIVEIALATGIAGITKDGLSDNGNPSFALNSSKNQLIINTASLDIPPAGTTQTYVVTINEVGGGQTLVTIDVQHGSVRISRVDIQRIAATPDVAPTVAAPTATKTDTSVTVANHITDTDGIRNTTYLIYSDAAGTILVNSNTSGAAFTGLTQSTPYWVKTTTETKNGATGVWTLQSSPLLAVTTNATLDLTPPLTTAAPSVTGTTDTATTLHATINENGTGYYLVLPAAAAAPTVAAVKAGTSFAMTANVAANQAISGLTASTAYKIYFVAKDTANNDQAAVSSVDVTTEAAPAIDTAPTVAAPTATKTDTTVTVTNHITDADGVQNITYSIYSDAATTILVNSNVNGAAFTGLTASTNYWVKTTAETRNGATGAWTLQTSPTLQVTTDAAVDHLAPDAPTGGPTLAAVGGVYYSKLATSNVTVTAAGVNGAGRIWLNGSDTGVDLIDGGSYNYDANVAEGNNNFNYTIKDAAGNESAPLTFSVFRDTVVPVVNDLPNWGAGVASGSTTAKTVTMTDNNPFAGSSVVSISPSVGSITGFDATTYGTNKPFNYVAPVNPAGSGPLTVTLTYTVRDAANNLTTQTQTFDVAEAPNANPVAQNFTADAAFNGFATVDLSGYISDAEDADAALQLIVTANPDNFTVDTSAWPTVTFIAPGGFLGNSSISYKIRDTLLGESGVQTITLNNFSN